MGKAAIDTVMQEVMDTNEVEEKIRKANELRNQRSDRDQRHLILGIIPNYYKSMNFIELFVLSS